MKARLTLLTLALVLPLSGCVTSKQLEVTNAQIMTVAVSVNNLSAQMAAQARANAAVKPIPEKGCYLAGERYSPGAVVAGRICSNQKVIIDDHEPDQWGWTQNLR